MVDPQERDDGGHAVEDSNDDGKVGYRRPPRQHQFKPGQSGNPRGRSKGAKGLKSELLAEINEQVTITVNGKPRKIRTLRLILKALSAKAAKGNVAAADKLLTLVIEAFGLEDERTAAKQLSDTDRKILSQFLGEEPSDA